MPFSANEKWSFWNARQRRAILIILAALLTWWAYQAYRNPTIITYPQTGPGIRAGELEDRLDPNSASAPDLAALPAIGPKVAREIVSYRKKYHREGRGEIAFKSANDLLKVPGIGFNTLQELAPYLKFPPEKATDVAPVLK